MDDLEDGEEQTDPDIKCQPSISGPAITTQQGVTIHSKRASRWPVEDADDLRVRVTMTSQRTGRLERDALRQTGSKHLETKLAIDPNLYLVEYESMVLMRRRSKGKNSSNAASAGCLALCSRSADSVWPDWLRARKINRVATVSKNTHLVTRHHLIWLVIRCTLANHLSVCGWTICTAQHAESPNEDIF